LNRGFFKKDIFCPICVQKGISKVISLLTF